MLDARYPCDVKQVSRITLIGSSEADKLNPQVGILSLKDEKKTNGCKVVLTVYPFGLRVVSSLRRKVGEMSDMIMLVTIFVLLTVITGTSQSFL